MKSNSRAKLFKKNAEDADEFASSARTSDCNSISQQVRKAQKHVLSKAKKHCQETLTRRQEQTPDETAMLTRLQGSW